MVSPAAGSGLVGSLPVGGGAGAARGGDVGTPLLRPAPVWFKGGLVGVREVGLGGSVAGADVRLVVLGAVE